MLVLPLTSYATASNGNPVGLLSAETNVKPFPLQCASTVDNFSCSTLMHYAIFVDEPHIQT